MKKIFLIFMLAMLLVSIRGTAQQLFKINSNISSVVFDTLYIPNFLIIDFKKSLNAVIYVNDCEQQINLKLDKKYKHYNRQYIGYVNIDNDEFLIVQMLNFKHRKKIIQRYYQDWESIFINGFGEFYEKNTELLKFDIKRKSFSTL